MQSINWIFALLHNMQYIYTRASIYRRILYIYSVWWYKCVRFGASELTFISGWSLHFVDWHQFLSTFQRDPRVISKTDLSSSIESKWSDQYENVRLKSQTQQKKSNFLIPKTPSSYLNKDSHPMRSEECLFEPIWAKIRPCAYNKIELIIHSCTCALNFVRMKNI